jgi:endonuclease/exonuclease/phosphatase (EEP) superfamily protein YafD
VGDFNITPWSVYYKWLQSAFSGVLTNVTKQFPVLFTRNLRKLPFVEAHIDHLRVSSGVTVTDLRSVVMPGSDHKAYIFDIQ